MLSATSRCFGGGLSSLKRWSARSPIVAITASYPASWENPNSRHRGQALGGGVEVLLRSLHSDLLAVLTSAQLKAACYRLAPQAAFTATGRAIFIALSGAGSVDGEGYRKLSTVYLDDGEEAEFVADEITVVRTRHWGA